MNILAPGRMRLSRRWTSGYARFGPSSTLSGTLDPGTLVDGKRRRRAMKMPPTDENSMLDKAVAGDATALSLLLEQVGPELRRRLAPEIPPRWRSILSVDDVMQETYIDAFLDIHYFHPRGSGSFLAWLTVLAKRNLVDALRMLEAEKRGSRRMVGRRREQRLTALYDELGWTHSTPSHHAARQEARDCLSRAISQLPATYRRVVEMYDLQGRTAAEVATSLSRTVGAVFMLRSRAHRILCANLGTASLYMSDTA